MAMDPLWALAKVSTCCIGQRAGSRLHGRGVRGLRQLDTRQLAVSSPASIKELSDCIYQRHLSSYKETQPRRDDIDCSREMFILFRSKPRCRRPG